MAFHYSAEVKIDGDNFSTLQVCIFIHLTQSTFAWNYVYRRVASSRSH